MVVIHGEVQREGDVVHLMARKLEDLSGDLARLSDLGAGLRIPAVRGDELANSTSRDSSVMLGQANRPRDIFIPDPAYRISTR